MPTLLRLCRGCRIARVSTGSRCPPCQAIAWRAQAAQRGTTTQRGLGWDYQRKRQRILQRDGFVCGVCGLPGATTVDHVVPRARGGSHEDHNLRAAHVRCNAGRGAGRAAKGWWGSRSSSESSGVPASRGVGADPNVEMGRMTLTGPNFLITHRSLR